MPIKPQRLFFIDVIRSIAILMMLEGHFITYSLQAIFVDDNNPIYSMWKFTRGLTAPIFFTTSGLIFTYLLLKDKQQGWKNIRLQKGIKRAFLLLFLGFMLQIKFYKAFFNGIPVFSDFFYIYHVLQCIGTCMLVIMGSYLLKTYLIKIPLGAFLLIIGLGVFIFTPALMNYDYTGIPRFVENVLIASKNTQIKISVFPMFPWSGFLFIGGFLGSIAYKYQSQMLTLIGPSAILAVGLILNFFGGELMYYLDRTYPFFHNIFITEVYQLTRLGHVFIFIAGVMYILHFAKNIKDLFTFSFLKNRLAYLGLVAWAIAGALFYANASNPWLIVIKYALFFIPIVVIGCKLIGMTPELFYSTGQNTLYIYVLHVIILYEGFIGYGFLRFVFGKLTPFEAICGMLLFEFFFIYFTKHIQFTKNLLSYLSLDRILKKNKS